MLGMVHWNSSWFGKCGRGRVHRGVDGCAEVGRNNTKSEPIASDGNCGAKATESRREGKHKGLAETQRTGESTNAY